MLKEKPSIAICFPVYNDEKTIRIVTEKSIKVLQKISSSWKITIINDGSPDSSGKIADELSKTSENINVVHHNTNLGYGAAVKSGLKASMGFDRICFTDGDDEYGNECEDKKEIRIKMELDLRLKQKKKTRISLG